MISLKETLDHSQITTTSRYTKALLEGQKKLVRGFEVADTEEKLINFDRTKKRKSS